MVAIDIYTRKHRVLSKRGSAREKAERDAPRPTRSETMERTQITDHDAERSIDTLRSTFKSAAAAVDELADALEDGEADEALVANTYREIAASMAAIEDAAEVADVIDPYEADWRAIDDLRAAMYHSAGAARSEARADRVIAPAPERSRNAALSDAHTAAEHLELARDGEAEFADSPE